MKPTTIMPQFNPGVGYLIATEGSALPIAWFITAEAAYDWKAKNQGHYVPLEVISCHPIPSHSSANNAASTTKESDTQPSSSIAPTSDSTHAGTSPTTG